MLLETLPLALGAAVSPIVLAITVAMLTGPGRTPRALAFLAGEAVPLLALAGLILLFGGGVSLKVSPTALTALDLVFAGILLAVGLRALWRALHRVPAKPPSTDDSHANVAPRRAFAIGVGSMTTNFTSLLLYLPALKLVAAADLTTADELIAAALVIVLVLSTVWLPLSLTRIAPITAEAALARIAATFQRNERLVTIVLGLGFGLYLLVRGLNGL